MPAMTIREVAALAGVSVSTVSRVINEMPDVSSPTQQKVLRIIEDLGYVPNASARILKRSSSKIICVIVKGIHNLFFAPIVEEIQRVIGQNGFIPFAAYIEETEDEVQRASHLIAEKKAQGVIFLGGNPAAKAREIDHLKVPCVLATMSAKGPGLKNASSVCVDDFESARQAVAYLISRGHRRIAILGGRLQDRDLVWQRYSGARKSLAEHGLPFDESRYIESKFSLEDAYRMTKQALDNQPTMFTALFAMSDIMAIGAIKAVFDSGRKVPDDVSVIGFDGISIASFYQPTLTTVRQPYEAIARQSAELMIQNIRGENLGRSIVLGTDIAPGSSVKDVFKQATA